MKIIQARAWKPVRIREEPWPLCPGDLVWCPRIQCQRKPGPFAPGPAQGATRKQGETSFFFTTHFKTEAVKVLPGEYFVANEDIPIMTTLGSCISACIWDRNAKVGA